MNNMTAVAVRDDADQGNPEIKHRYLEALTLIERLHRRLLDVIKDEFDRNGEQESTQFRRCFCSTSATAS
jgi:hypothetical protein